MLFEFDCPQCDGRLVVERGVNSVAYVACPHCAAHVSVFLPTAWPAEPSEPESVRHEAGKHLSGHNPEIGSPTCENAPQFAGANIAAPRENSANTKSGGEEEAKARMGFGTPKGQTQSPDAGSYDGILDAMLAAASESLASVSKASAVKTLRRATDLNSTEAKAAVEEYGSRHGVATLSSSPDTCQPSVEFAGGWDWKVLGICAFTGAFLLFPLSLLVVLDDLKDTPFLWSFIHSKAVKSISPYVIGLLLIGVSALFLEVAGVLGALAVLFLFGGPIFVFGLNVVRQVYPFVNAAVGGILAGTVLGAGVGLTVELSKAGARRWSRPRP